MVPVTTLRTRALSAALAREVERDMTIGREALVPHPLNTT